MPTQNSFTNTGNNAASPVFAGVFLIVFLLFAIAMIALMIFVWGTIFKKAGYSFWMALLMIIPLVNLIWLLIFAFSKWPIQQEMESLRGRGGYPTGGFPVGAPPMR